MKFESEVREKKLSQSFILSPFLGGMIDERMDKYRVVFTIACVAGAAGGADGAATSKVIASTWVYQSRSQIRLFL